MRPLAEKTIIKRIQDYIKSNKYLMDAKYFKNNYWSWAAWNSWAAKGQAGGCGVCNNNYYNGSLRNKRAKTKTGGRNEKWSVNISRNLCHDCINRIQIEINFEFKRI